MPGGVVGWFAHFRVEPPINRRERRGVVSPNPASFDLMRITSLNAVAARAFIATTLAAAIEAEVKDSHKMLTECRLVLEAIKAGSPCTEEIELALDHLEGRAEALHHTDSRAAIVAHAARCCAKAIRYRNDWNLESAFTNLAALHLPEKTHDAMWDFLRGDRDDSTLPAQWKAFLATSQAA